MADKFGIFRLIGCEVRFLTHLFGGQPDLFESKLGQPSLKLIDLAGYLPGFQAYQCRACPNGLAYLDEDFVDDPTFKMLYRLDVSRGNELSLCWRDLANLRNRRPYDCSDDGVAYGIKGRRPKAPQASIFKFEWLSDPLLEDLQGRNFFSR